MSEMEENRTMYIHGLDDLTGMTIYDAGKWKLSVYDPTETDAYEIRGFDVDRVFEANEDNIKLFLCNYKAARGLIEGNYIHISYSNVLRISMRIEDVKLHHLKVDDQPVPTLVIQLDGRPKIKFN